jgi:hypothetical protein
MKTKLNYSSIMLASAMLVSFSNPAGAAVSISGDDESDCTDNGCSFVVGYTSPGSLVVDGGSVFTGPGSTYPGDSILGVEIGFYAGADHSSVSINGPGSAIEGYTDGSSLRVGLTIGHGPYATPPVNSNSFSITGGGFLNGGISCYGDGSSILVTDPGSHVLGGVVLGGSDTVFTVQNGATVDNGVFDFEGDSNDVVIVTGTNTVCSNSWGSFDSATNCSLVISNGAQMLNENGGGLGWFFGSNGESNRIVLEGPGTLMTVTSPGGGYGIFFGGDIGDQLIVSKGAQAVTSGGLGTANSGGSECVRPSVTITDPGTKATIGGRSIFSEVSGFQLTISNGAQVAFSGDIEDEGTGDTLLVTGAGSQLLAPTNTIYMGSDGSFGPLDLADRLIIAQGCLVTAANLYVTADSLVSVCGRLTVTNSNGSGTLGLGGNGGALTITGCVVADMVSLEGTYYDGDNFHVGPGGPVTFTSGTFMTKGLGGNNNFTFIVGDGTNTANYLMQGGTHSFVNGLVISSNSVLSGCGTVTGSVTNYGLIILTNGCDMNFTGPVVNDGTILALNGTAYFGSTLTNNGTFLQTPGITGVSFSGNDVIVQFNTVSNYSHDVQFTSDLTSGIWTTLTNGLLGTGNAMTITNFGGLTNSQRFYRLLFYY